MKLALDRLGGLFNGSRALSAVEGRRLDPDVVAGLSEEALWALARNGDLDRCATRLVELVIGGTLDSLEPWEVTEFLVGEGWAGWSDGQRGALLGCFDAWWQTLLHFHPYTPGVDVALAALAQFDEPLIRWLQPLLEGLDGPGAEHLADLVIGRLSSPGWDRRPDRRLQVLAWSGTEPVVLGLTLVGGVHLSDGRLGRALDRMLGSDDSTS